jgi:hypothetical protein
MEEEFSTNITMSWDQLDSEGKAWMAKTYNHSLEDLAKVGHFFRTIYVQCY